MTNTEAAAKAQELWGNCGVVRVITYRRERTYVVGTIGALPSRIAYGSGNSWDEAFADAQRYAAERAQRATS